MKKILKITGLILIGEICAFTLCWIISTYPKPEPYIDLLMFHCIAGVILSIFGTTFTIIES